MESWPKEASQLKQRNWVSYLYLVVDILLVLLPMFFILLGIAVITLHRKPTKGSSFGTKVEFATQLGPTIFPILFAAIIGRSMKMIARYLAEKGAKLSTLELLMASQSVWGTFESQFLMRRLTVVGAHLLILCSLSPLGGQASLRLLGTADQANNTPQKIRYLTTGPGGTMWGLETVYIGNGEFADVDALYNAALLAPNSIKLGPQDTWGNVKIPSMVSLNESTADAHGWISTPTTMAAAEDYSSLMGLPVVGRPLNANANFSMESTYLSVQCSKFTQTLYPNFFHNIASPPDFAQLSRIISGRVWTDLNSGYNPLNGTTFFMDTDLPLFDGSIAMTTEDVVATSRFDGFIGFLNSSATRTASSTAQRNLIFGSVFLSDAEKQDWSINMANCSVMQTHIESAAECVKDQCSVNKIRKSLTDKRASELTGFDHNLITSQFVTSFAKSQNQGRGSSPTERFLSNSTEFPFIQTAGNLESKEVFIDLSKIPSDAFSRRLSLLLNTYYQLSVGPTGYFGSLPQNLSLYGPDTIPVKDIDAYLLKNLSATSHTYVDWWPTFQDAVDDNAIGTPFIGATTNATITTHEQVFFCSFAWLSLLLAASTIILVTGAAALLLRRKTIAPEMFGFVTSMTYENTHVKIPPGGNVLDAMERARLLKDVKVRVGDVRGEADVGHIAFSAGVKVRTLERGRLYK
ncbi:uncharacterized protein BDZ99DRAFT_485502 [Mytilinidion resinicola]|uniref:Uncharacterized protein n=1 Tax=Mytilinidion resinicola TaxID=574789 RepID=A0A6A6Z1K9_9PEZI|nr:uncharacterized protein BDZ99DRAFT_485502 [Mytilinidion resinicola]KAF2814991.1 hypothetical protein BDZ99DRAFT_485502 [Mytilinidion resinicola]